MGQDGGWQFLVFLVGRDDVGWCRRNFLSMNSNGLAKKLRCSGRSNMSSPEVRTTALELDRIHWHSLLVNCWTSIVICALCVPVCVLVELTQRETRETCNWRWVGSLVTCRFIWFFCRFFFGAYLYFSPRLECRPLEKFHSERDDGEKCQQATRPLVSPDAFHSRPRVEEFFDLFHLAALSRVPRNTPFICWLLQVCRVSRF